MVANEDDNGNNYRYLSWAWPHAESLYLSHFIPTASQPRKVDVTIHVSEMKNSRL